MKLQTGNGTPLRILAAAWQGVELEFTPHPVIGCLAARSDAVMISRSIAFLFVAVALGGCCVSGSGCYSPVPGTPIAWDGLGPAPMENGSEYKPKRASRPNTEIVVGPLNGTAAQADPKSEPQDRWTQEQAADRDADAKLTKQLMICRNC